MISFSHVALVVTDLQRSVDFYRKALGFEVISRSPDTGRGFELVLMGVGGCGIVELLGYKDEAQKSRPRQGRYDHLALFVDDLRATIAQVAPHGVSFESDPRKLPDGREIVFFAGPDGERIELMQPAK